MGKMGKIRVCHGLVMVVPKYDEELTQQRDNNDTWEMRFEIEFRVGDELRRDECKMRFRVLW